MKLKTTILVISLIVFTNCNQLRKQEKTQNKSQEKVEVISVIQGHAHNDYEHERPLFYALENGFVSVEADVYLIDDQLYVTHDIPETLDPSLTLEALYLEPLKQHVQANHGAVYPDYDGVFYLMVDFKTEAVTTYNKLKEILVNYQNIITTVKNGVEQKKVIKIFISGERPKQEILNDDLKLAFLDGRPKDLESNISSLIMPVVSDNYINFLSWDGAGDIDKNEEQRFKDLVKNTHAQGKVLRLWASPDNENVWRFLLNNDVDLINTDLLAEFRDFFLEHKASKK